MSMPALFKGRLSLPAIAAPLFIISVPDRRHCTMQGRGGRICFRR